MDLTIQPKAERISVRYEKRSETQGKATMKNVLDIQGASAYNKKHNKQEGWGISWLLSDEFRTREFPLEENERT